MIRTRRAEWAGRSFAVSFLLLALVLVAYNSDLLGEAFGQGTAGGLALWVVAAISAIGTLWIGATSWLKHKDRSPMVIVATIYGVLALALFVIGPLPD